MLFAAIGSGSRGNAYAFWNEDAGILVDVGLSYKQLRERMDALELDPWLFRALLISHYHGDHTNAIRTWVKKHGGVVHTHPDTAGQIPYLVDNPYLVQAFEFREPFTAGPFRVIPWPVVHDTPGAVTFSIEDQHHKVSMILETGRITAEIAHDAQDADALIVEANHDPSLVADSVNGGDIPESTGGRILNTHLRNKTAAQFIAAHSRAKVAVLAHLSEDRNRPDLAVAAFEQAMADEFRPADDIYLLVSEQASPTPVIDLASFVGKPQRSVQRLHEPAA